MAIDFSNKRILITGGTGSRWNELTAQLLNKYNPKEIIIYSRWELAQVNMSRKFSEYNNIKYMIWDVRDLTRLKECMKNINYVFHLAALKHVPICEDYPEESVKTNVIGTENVIKSAKANNIELVIDVSTDKACNPINVYWSSKSLGEKLMLKANDEHSNTKFVCIRAWNVMWSNWSIIPFFKELLQNNKPLPITDLDMTRYFMTLSEAIWLIFKATTQCKWGEIFVTKMPACRIIDLASVLADYYKKKLNYKIIWIRPWEKLNEELVSEYEAIETVEDKNFRIILPMDWILDEHYKDFPKMKEKKYTSNDYLMDKKEIKEMLREWGFLN